jgi:hypothetical protein
MLPIRLLIAIWIWNGNRKVGMPEEVKSARKVWGGKTKDHSKWRGE